MDIVTNALHPEAEAIGSLRRLPFVRDLQYTPGHDKRDPAGKLRVRTPRGRFQLLVEEKRSYLSRPDADRLVVWLSHSRTDAKRPVIVLARHVPRPAAEALMAAKVNFADDAGNVHLELGNAYNWTSIGLPARERASERRPANPAQLQLLFQFVTHPESVNWPVRKLEAAAGIGKSRAAQARRQMLDEGLLIRTGKQYGLGPKTLLADRLMSGYAQVLRPKLFLGRFRPAEKTAEAFLNRLRTATPSGVRYSLTGGPAADLLQHFYRGPEAPLFLKPCTRDIARQLRLLPDREGPVTILNAFGELVFWEKRGHHRLAPPWLIYAELLAGNDPRAHEAAREFRREFIG
jgi:hypothetical protein